MEESMERSVRISREKAQYDEYAKNLLSQKIVLAHILANAVSEFDGMEPEDVIPLIEGDPEVGITSVLPGETNQLEISSAIGGSNTENKIPGEGSITYDVRFFVWAPGKVEKIKIIVDMEAQKKFKPGYNLVTRGVFYASRMISAQLDTEFTIPHFKDIKKVYSIWICMNVPQRVQNTITEFCIGKKNVVGNSGNLGRYDLLSVIMVGLPKELSEEKQGVKLHRFLGTLFSDRIPVHKKKEILTQEFGISMTPDLERSVNIMCNLSEAIEERGRMEGIKEGREEMIAQFLRNENHVKIVAKLLGVSEDVVRFVAEKEGIDVVS